VGKSRDGGGNVYLNDQPRAGRPVTETLCEQTQLTNPFKKSKELLRQPQQKSLTLV
jgi:hypothetical protein